MNPLPTRRTFFQRAGLVPLAAAATLPPRPAAADVAPIERVGGSHLRVALNAYSFLEPLTANAKDPAQGIDLFGVCDFCARHDSTRWT